VKTIAKDYPLKKAVCFTWGNDWWELENACALHEIVNIFPPMINLGYLFAIAHGNGQKVSLGSGTSSAIRSSGMSAVSKTLRWCVTLQLTLLSTETTTC
jgi:hypothetical protein